ncbi:MAG: TIGR03790 family protein [Acidobacteriia bacterium]|nr:TIGR03790 family protein [Terriglobia bacterium]
MQLPRCVAQSPDNVLLVVNDNSEDSKAIARYYAEKRKLPAANICRLRTTESDTISRDTFEREILRPVADHLRSQALQDQILYIVTTRGLPLVVDGNASPIGDLASVDTELALVYRYLVMGSFPYHGRVENPYFAVEFNRENFRPFVRRDYDIYLVTRLTGSSAVHAILLVDRALAAEANGDFYFDLASAQQSAEADWTQQAAAALKEAGRKATVDNTGKVLDNLAAVQGYLNQGSADMNLAGRIPQIQWSPGALATVLDKVTARIWRGQNRDQDAGSLAARFVESGVTGFVGYVADPTPDGYIRPQILFPAYAAGYNLAEACYAASRYLSWREIVIGDPLASPYSKNSARQRSDLAAAFHPGIDKETGLPEHFSQRRQLNLTQKYSTGREAVVGLLKAEAAAGRGDDAGALALIDKSLEQDPYIAESHLLKAQLLERGQDFVRSFDDYRKALELGQNSREMHLKLARLALDKLRDPGKAAPFTLWLYSRYGKADPELAMLYADVEMQNGRPDEAKTVYQRLVSELNPPPALALAGLGRIQFEQRNFDQAKDLLTRALELNRDESKASTDHQDSGMRLDEEEVRRLLQKATSQPAKPKDGVSVTVGTPETKSDGKTYPVRIISQSEIPYPFVAHLNKVEGQVVVALLIDEMGQVMKGMIVSGDRRLAKAVIDSAKLWRFEPRMENGRAVTSWYTLPVNFKLTKKPPDAKRLPLEHQVGS